MKVRDKEIRQEKNKKERKCGRKVDRDEEKNEKGKTETDKREREREIK